MVRRIFDMALRGRSTLDIAKALNAWGIPRGFICLSQKQSKALNAWGIPTANGKKWLKTTVHVILTNEAYAGTVVWGANAKDGQPPVRVEDAHPSIVSKEEFRRIAGMM